MLEQAVVLIMSQALKYLLEGEDSGITARDKQILRKELVADLVSGNNEYNIGVCMEKTSV